MHFFVKDVNIVEKNICSFQLSKKKLTSKKKITGTFSIIVKVQSSYSMYKKQSVRRYRLNLNISLITYV